MKNFEKCTGEPVARPGNSVGLNLDTSDTVGISISAVSYSSAGAGHYPRTGFGIIFGIAPTSDCGVGDTAAEIFGFDPAGGETVWAWRNPLGYDYQPTLQAPELGIASVKLRATGCTNGQVIRVKAYIPGDMEYLVPGQRFPTRLDAARLLEITVIDITPPETFINSAPANPDNSKDASFEFSCSETGCTFECQLDAGGWAGCSSPKNYSALLDGLHTFEVRATDASLNTDPTPATLIWRIDTIPPTLTIVSPADGATTNTTIAINITYSDTGSGIDLASLLVYHNDTDITSTLSKSASSATGSATGVAGGNLFNVWVSDNAGNSKFAYVLVLIEDGTAATISAMSPGEGETVHTFTPIFSATYSDSGSGVDLTKVSITVNGVDRTSSFAITPGQASWRPDFRLTNGANTWEINVCDKFNNCATQTSNFTVDSTCPNFDITQVSPEFAIGGDTVRITGANFGNTVNVEFSSPLSPLNGTTVRGWAVTSTQFGATVPGSAVSGDIRVENPAGSGCYSVNPVHFEAFLPYAYITNRQSHNVSVIDYRNNSYVKTVAIPGASPTPYSADVTPDGRWVLIANRATNNVTILDTLDNNTIEVANVTLACGHTITYPQQIAVSPDGSRALVVANDKHLRMIDIKKKLVDGSTCSGVEAEPEALTQGASFLDIDFTPDGEDVIIPTGNAAVSGKIYALESGRYYLVDDNSNTLYLKGDYYTEGILGNEANSQKQPYGTAVLPQMFPNVEWPWGVLVVNKGAGTDTDEDTTWLDVRTFPASPKLQGHDVLDTTAAGHPICYGGSDAAISNLGERAFIAFTNTNNIGVTGALNGSTPDVLAATAPNYYTGSMREIAYTPVGDKVLATCFSTLWTDSHIIILNALAVPVGATGTISTSAYTAIQNPYMIGPEGIGMMPLFDRDGDKMSDLVEAANSEGIIQLAGGTVFLNPSYASTITSVAKGTPASGSLSGGVRLPDEGIGYRHFYGTTHDLRIGDDFATLSTIQAIERVGREWNLLPGLTVNVPRPRISIGDMCDRDGGYWRPGIGGHENGLELDIRYVRSDGAESNYTFNPQPPHPEGYSKDETQRLTDLLCKAGAKRILADSEANLIAHYGCNISDPGAHEDHFHVRFVDWP